MRNVFQIIQGDSFNMDVTLKTNGTLIDTSLISKVYLSCKGLNKQYQATLNNNKYAFSIPATDTKDYEPNQYDYDITIIFVDGKVRTCVYENGLIILAKHNGVVL